MKIKHIISSLFLAFLFAGLWQHLEEAIYGVVESRVVDDIMLLFMMPFFYATSAWLEDRQNKQENTMNQNVRNDEKVEEE